jgi:hypothetical protein
MKIERRWVFKARRQGLQICPLSSCFDHKTQGGAQAAKAPTISICNCIILTKKWCCTRAHFAPIQACVLCYKAALAVTKKSASTHKKMHFAAVNCLAATAGVLSRRHFMDNWQMRTAAKVIRRSQAITACIIKS